MGTDGFSNSSHWWPATDRSYVKRGVSHVNHTVHDRGDNGTTHFFAPMDRHERRRMAVLGAPAQRYWLRHQETATQRLQMGGSFLVWVFGALTLSQNHVEILGTGTTYRCTLGAVWHASPITADIFEQFDAFPPRFPSDPTNPSFLTNPN